MGFRLTFYSNFLNHHQIPLCEEFYRLLGNDFCFVETRQIDQERIDLGWKSCNEATYLLKSYESEQARIKAMKLGLDSELVIFGDAPEEFIKERLNQDKLTFRYNERFFKQGLWKIFYPPIAKKYYNKHIKYKNKQLYMLCASAYTAYDCMRLGAYRNKCFKWGYFPETKDYSIDEVTKIENQDCLKILWVGRLIWWKRPELMVKVAKTLRDNGYHFTLDIVGSGVGHEKIKCMINKYNLESIITLTGSMSPQDVRKKMLESDILVATSNYMEGWGAVINEAMNSGCAVIASHAIGAVPFLLENNKNGLIFKNGDKEDLYRKLETLLNEPSLVLKYGEAAYSTLINTWNAKVAAERFIELGQSIINQQEIFYSEGPCSEATIIKNNWYNNNNRNKAI